MVFLDCTHWTQALREGSFVLSMKQDMNIRQVVAVTGASGKMGPALAKTLSKGNNLIQNQMRNDIKEKAKELFLYYGLKSVSMDDIAKKAAVSKKTIYEFFEDKNELVNEIVHDLMRSYAQLFKTSQINAEDAIEEVIKQNDDLLEIWTSIRPGFIYDLERIPEVSDQLEQYKLIIRKSIILNLRRGRREGNYREDIDIALVSDLRFHQLMNVMKPNLLTSHELNVAQLAREFTLLYLHAITTEKGKTLLDKYLNKTVNRLMTLDGEIR